MTTRKLSVPVRRVSILVKEWDNDHKLFRIILCQGRSVRNLIWDPKKFPNQARMTIGGCGLLTVPDTIDDGVLGKLAVDAIKTFRANTCPKVKKVETLMKRLADNWLILSVN